MSAIPRPPLPYDPRHEYEEEGEQDTKAQLLQTLHGISSTTYKDSGHATRSVHAKSHGLLRGQLQVWTTWRPSWRKACLPGRAAIRW